MTRTSLTIGLVCLASVVVAQDPVKVDPKHYRVEFENAQVRVLHIQYGPHEKSVMHHHPAGVAVFLSDQDAKFPCRTERPSSGTGRRDRRCGWRQRPTFPRTSATSRST